MMREEARHPSTCVNVMGTISLEAKKLTFGFVGIQKPLFQNLSFRFSAKNSPYALIGKAKAGKSTFLLLLSGFILPLSGDVLLNGASIFKNFSSKRQIGACFQSLGPSFFSERERIKMLLRWGFERKIAKRLNREFERRYSRFVKKSKKASACRNKKELKKNLIFWLLNKKFNVLIFDEPEKALNKAEAEKFLLMLKSHKAPIKIIATYDEKIFSSCKTVVFISRGKIVKVYPVRNSAAFCGNL